ncbi:MAG TPA: putative Ig domain-containing protein [Candidatus Acidoferrales bacterium]
MSRRAGLYLGYVFLFVACVYGGGCNGCTGAPSNFNQVTLQASRTSIPQDGTVVITATVANDTSNSGVSWTLSGIGSLSGSSKTSVTYTAPATVASPTMVTVHAASVEFPSQTASIQITVEPPVSITTTALPAGNYGSPYSGTINASGGVAPFTWTISAGSLTTGLNLGSSTTNSITIAGTPTVEANSSFAIKVTDSVGSTATQALSIAIGAPLPLSVTTTSLPSASLNVAYTATTLQASGGVPPYSWSLFSGVLPPGLSLSTGGTISGTPTQAGLFAFTVFVSDSENPALTAKKVLSISVGDLAALNGNYAFEFNGFNSSGNPLAIAGSFTADGAGHITNGIEDFNAIGASPQNQTFTGTYTVGGDNQGLLSFSSLSNSPSYSFSINANSARGRLIEFDATGTRGSGDLELRTVTTCTASTFNGHYAFGLTGQSMAVQGVSVAGPDAIVGSFTATPAISGSTQGSFSLGELDAVTPVKVTTKDQTLTGTYQASSQATHCTMSLSSTVQATMNFSVYPISASQSFIVETDTLGSTSPILTAGTMQQQVGAPYSLNSGSTFNAVSVGALTGREPVGTSLVPDVALISVSGTGAAGFTLSDTENLAGAVTTNSMQSTFIQADQFGRVATSPTTPFDPVFYMITQNTAYCLGSELNSSSQTYPLFGVLQPQSAGPFDASTIASVFIEGTATPATSAVPNDVGVVIFANPSGASGAFAGLQDQSTPQANTPAVSLTGTYSVSDATAGTGTLALTQPSAATRAFVIVSPNEVLMITTTTGDTDPVIEIFEQ